MMCPVKWCRSETDGTQLVGTIPGIKRHVARVHGQALYSQVQWPDIYRRVRVGDVFGERFQAREGSLALKSLNELRQEAKRRGVSSLGKSKRALYLELSNMDTEQIAAPPPGGEQLRLSLP